MIRLLLVFLFSFSTIDSFGQWTIVNEVFLKNIDQYDQDQLGNIYLSTENGDIKKYNDKGSLLAEYSSSASSKVHQLAAISQLKVLVFYENLQEYVILDRYLRSPARYSIQEFEIGFVSEIAANFQQNVWVVDRSDFTLKMLDVNRNMIVEKKSLARILNQNEAEISSLIIHQNRLYLTDAHNKVYIFDSIGNFEMSIVPVNNGNFQFYQDYTYYVNQDDLILKNLYNESETSVELPLQKMEKILFNDQRLVHFTSNGFVIYKYLSDK
ncbi:MAG: hypothetical protein JXR07_02795 [Reichenbachiella sp.]